MKEFINGLLAAEGITVTGALSLGDCIITKKYLLERAQIKDGSCIVFAIPYLSKEADTCGRNISAYAVARDYHAFVKALADRLIPILCEKFQNNRFAFFADHSPIDERDAAVKCGIGSFGDNRLIINEKYSSLFFLGELITDAHLEPDSPCKDVCLHCGACQRACPMTVDGCDCMSAITQKKGELGDSEENLIRKYKCAWGCDICQDVCPITVRQKMSGEIYTSVPFFCESITPHLTPEAVSSMSEAEFEQRAYSWRGRDVILRNLFLTEGGSLKNEAEEKKREGERKEGSQEGK